MDTTFVSLALVRNKFFSFDKFDDKFGTNKLKTIWV